MNKKTIAALIFTFSCLFFTGSWSQDGEALFGAKCSACHILGKDGTGPNLVNVKSRWEGEEEQLYEWVKNPAKVIAEGNSQRAQEVKDYSPTEMPVQNVSVDEAKAIIDYADSWAPPKEEESATTEETTTVVVPDYDKNLSIFYGLLAVIGFLLLGIFIVSKSTAALIKSDLFKEKVSDLHKKNKGNGDLVRAIALLLGFSFVSGDLSAFSFEAPAIAKDVNVWVYIEQTDLYVLLIIALLLLGFLMHMINMFYKVLRIMKPKKRSTTAEESQRSFTRALTGATPIEEEDKIDTGHEYDGIRELDNPMPPWWLVGFFISIVFAVVYMFHYHVLGTGDLQMAEYNKSMEKAQKEIQEYREKMAMNVDETNATLMVDDSDLMKGKTLFNNNCKVCHTETGGGDTGPNLTDDYWIYGNDVKDVFKVIKYGTPNGMPKHESKFNPIQLQQVASYVLHLELVTTDQGGLEPQGDFYGEESTSDKAEKDSIQ
ncbi:MAG: cbb3-type cytochrome c oxidase N-terminal domain-containing protein [Bacteroidota bacterium]